MNHLSGATGVSVTIPESWAGIPQACRWVETILWTTSLGCNGKGMPIYLGLKNLFQGAVALALKGEFC